ncbi:unnamed protein product [Ranitomeya imitator]|uniref:Reverse transcriptase domain-containing protein n=1 Tax=Ranitomeya imitator TaxID=111125 RepID=A0ABN9KV38_9NEOB|nr:unnamed protein product [Ranitomeya imitator]
MDSKAIFFLLDLLHLNFFIFEDTFYVQVQGSAMGFNVAPPYANGFMSSFETEFIYSNELYQSHCLLWRRYIDDVFRVVIPKAVKKQFLAHNLIESVGS